jgi:hypothetical protein
MPEKKSEKQTIEVYKGEKIEGRVDESKLRKSTTTPPAAGEVEGRGMWVHALCPHCGSLQFAWWNYEGEGFICGNCHRFYRIWV